MLDTLINHLDAWISPEITLAIATGISIGALSASWFCLRCVKLISAQLKCSIDLVNMSEKALFIRKIVQKSEKIVRYYEKLNTLLKKATQYHPQAAAREAQEIIDLYDGNVEFLKQACDKANSAREMVLSRLEALKKGQSISKEEHDKLKALDLEGVVQELKEIKGELKQVSVALKEILEAPPEVEKTPSAASAKSDSVLTSLKEGAAVLFGFKSEVPSSKTSQALHLKTSDAKARGRSQVART